MKNKSDGFIYIECVVSLSIIIIATYMLCTSLEYCYRTVDSNLKNKEVTNLAKDILYEYKYRVESSDEEIIEDCYDTSTVNSYKIESSLLKDVNYYRCYKINVTVSDSSKNILELNSYVTQK